MSGWLELRLRLPAAHCAALESALEALGALAITEGEGDVDVFAEPGVVNADSWSMLSLTALFDEAAEVDAIEAAVSAALGSTDACTWQAIPDQPWHQVWKQDWSPQSYAGGLCVCPSWCEPPADASHVIRLDPGGAFGTGTHETTALCLDWIGAVLAPGRGRVIDYGCGSGILAIAAAKRGIGPVVAVDIDDEALAVARENVVLNDCTAAVSVARPESLADGTADVLLANILLEPLLLLAPRFTALVVRGGAIALSGLLATQLPQVEAAYRAAFVLDAPVIRGDWALLTGTRR